MESFTELLEFQENMHYERQKKECLGKLTAETIDLPIAQLINNFNKLPYCFTLQCCHGHFIQNGENCTSLTTADNRVRVEYRIAYIAFCIENSVLGKEFFNALNSVVVIDPHNIQFCCAEWFWEWQVNSYVIQVEPVRFKTQDSAVLDYNEACTVEGVRNECFEQLEKLVKNLSAGVQ